MRCNSSDFACRESSIVQLLCCSIMSCPTKHWSCILEISAYKAATSKKKRKKLQGKLWIFMISGSSPEIFIVRAAVCLFVLLLWAFVLQDQYTLVITYQQSMSQGFTTGHLVNFILPWAGSLFSAVLWSLFQIHIWKLHSHNLQPERRFKTTKNRLYIMNETNLDRAGILLWTGIYTY